MPTQNWFVVVNRKSAKVFEIVKRPKGLSYLRTLRNPLGTTRNREMMNDKPGMSRSRFAGAKGPHAMTREKNPHEDVAVEFAKRISIFLKQNKNENNFTTLTIAAEPHMMGLVKKFIDKDPMKIEVQWLRKDLEKMTTDKLEDLYFKSVS